MVYVFIKVLFIIENNPKHYLYMPTGETLLLTHFFPDSIFRQILRYRLRYVLIVYRLTDAALL